MPRFLYSNPNSGGGGGHFPSAAAAPEPIAVDSDVVVVLAALLCALICVIGLALVARCAWIRRSSLPVPPPHKGLKKKALRSLPKLNFEASAGSKLVECPICLGEFVDGDEVRVLPQCGHGFHLACVDAWLGAHPSCPFCRQVLVVLPAAALPLVRCQKCGASSAAAEADVGTKAREDGDANRFLP